MVTTCAVPLPLLHPKGLAMRHQTRLGVMLTCLLLLLPLMASALPQFTGQVVGILDGDTVRVLREGVAVKVRLYGIDAPEKAQPYGMASKQFLSGLLYKKTVTVQVVNTDLYGRLVGIVTTDKNTSVNATMVAAGMAWWYKTYAPHDVMLFHLEQQARESRLGLWQGQDAKAPWLWRKAKKSKIP